MLVLVFLYINLVLTTVNGLQTPGTKEKCLKENYLTKEKYESLKEKDDPEVGCVLACIMAKKGMMKNTTINIEQMKKQKFIAKKYNVSEEAFNKLIDSCFVEALKENGKCKRALTINKCVMNGLQQGSTESTTTSEMQSTTAGDSESIE